MDTATVIDLTKQALWIIILVSAPLLSVTLIVGIIVGIIQAATSINEMTLSFIPKILLLALALTLFGNWQISVLLDYMRSIFEKIPTLFQ